MATENEYTDMDVTRVNTCDKVWKKSFFITLILNGLALTSLLALHLYNQFKPVADPDSLELSQDLCVPCQEETALSDYKVQTQTGKYLCCYNNTDILRAVNIMLKEERRFRFEFSDVKQYTPRHDTVVNAKELKWWKERRSAAHLHLDIGGITETDLTTVRWRSNSSFVTSFVSDGVEVVDKRMIQVSERGMYFIYSTISVEFSKMSQNQPNKHQGFYHTIQKGNKNLKNTGPSIQMIRKYGGNPADETDRLYTSFLCGALFLQKGDQLTSELDEPPLIYKFPYANYFGIFKL
ncbi:uncharacterized protein LOC132564022 [Ylistrum balloti]|uniref:uncharacterized protein LOC132564022 n=1 Tax=Ylistrum balloti TaxID=509963 RepID=UPI002905D829|nr:uncharacterized protein LOC132564022 [Ylistrum balloti]